MFCWQYTTSLGYEIILQEIFQHLSLFLINQVYSWGILQGREKLRVNLFFCKYLFYNSLNHSATQLQIILANLES